MIDMKYWLQFFAESASGEEEATGVESAAAGQENQDTGNRGQGTEPAAAEGFTWEDVLARDDMKQHISDIVSQRVGDIRKRYKPMLETLASHHGIAADAEGHFNENDIIKAVTNDPAYYDKTASTSGIADPAIAQQIAMIQEQARRREAEADEIIQRIKNELEDNYLKQMLKD